jgi:hypothetical protein
MRDFNIIPHVGIGPVRIGMSRAEVHSALGEPEHCAPNGRECFLSGFMVDFNENGLVEFIEIASSNRFRGVFRGKCLHELPAEEALAHVSQFDEFDRNDPELGYSYTFVGLQMALWRGTMPDPGQDIKDADGRHFESISVAENGYFEAK